MDNETINLAHDRYLYLSEYNQVINACMKKRFLARAARRRIPIKDENIDETAIKRRVRSLQQVIFEVTENCNLRCKYCVFNGNYINQRELAPHNMNFETAKKGLDYLYSLVKDRREKQFTLGFYGGEPMLNFRLVRRIVSYARSCFTGWNLRFNMTSNLTLLNEAVLDFLVENDFTLLVSLDGGKENHDAKRVFPDGTGTHDIVMGNLEKIAKRDKDYFKRKVSFSTVYSLDLPLGNLYEFFCRSELVKRKRMRFSIVNNYNTDYYEKYPGSRPAFQEELQRIAARVLEKVKGNEELFGYEREIYSNLKGIGDSLENRSFSTLAGSCLFDSRLYLDAHGRFHICEKMNNTFSFGDVDNGFDFEKMAAIAGQFTAIVKDKCSQCSIRFLCQRCYVAFTGSGQLELDPKFCKDQEESIVRNLEKFIECKEEALV